MGKAGNKWHWHYVSLRQGGHPHKDLILCAHHTRGELPEEGVTYFVTRRVVLEITAVFPGKNKRQSLYDSGRENVS